MKVPQGLVTDPNTKQVLQNSLCMASSRNTAPDCRPPPAARDSQASVFSGSVCLLSSEGSLEPQIEALIHRINELQQGKFGNLDRPVGTSRKEPGL